MVAHDSPTGRAGHTTEPLPWCVRSRSHQASRANLVVVINVDGIAVGGEGAGKLYLLKSTSSGNNSNPLSFAITPS